MRVLILTTAYGPGRPHAPLMETLADVMAADGHQVRVAGVNWDAAAGSDVRHYTEANGVEVLMAPPRQVERFGRVGRLLGKWVLSSWHALPAVKRAFGDDEYDLLMVMTPAVTLHALIRWARRRARRSYAYITDFFPVQHVSAGLLPSGPLSALAMRAETALLRGFDRLGTMSPLGVRFLRERFALDPRQPIETLYLWTDTSVQEARPTDEVRRAFSLPCDRRIIVFGGQLTHGRGVEDMLAAAELSAKAGSNLLFLFIGSGVLQHLVDAHIAAGHGNVALLPALSHDAYVEAITCCDAGLVATTGTHATPTFPSKTIDYLKAGLPVVASVDSASDYDSFVNQRGFGVAIHAGDPARLAAAIEEVTGDPERMRAMREAGRATLMDIFSARRAADQVLGVRPADMIG